MGFVYIEYLSAWIVRLSPCGFIVSWMLVTRTQAHSFQ
jgi:hypothetical protein